MLLCPSLMCADYGNLRATVEELDAAGIDIFHCDVMDGSFVPNFAMGLEDIKAVRAATNKLVDVHLMVENPASKVELFAAAGADIIYIHPESERYVVKTLNSYTKKIASLKDILKTAVSYMFFDVLSTTPITILMIPKNANGGVGRIIFTFQHHRFSTQRSSCYEKSVVHNNTPPACFDACPFLLRMQKGRRAARRTQRRNTGGQRGE